MSHDLVIQGGVLTCGARADVANTGDRIAAGAPGITAAAGQLIDAGDKLVSTRFIDCDIHLDAGPGDGTPRNMSTGTIPEGIRLLVKRKVVRTRADIIDGALRYCGMAAGQGISDAGPNPRSGDLCGCDLGTTCEPCEMCAAAMSGARIDPICYAQSAGDCADMGFERAPLCDLVRSDRQARADGVSIGAGRLAMPGLMKRDLAAPEAFPAGRHDSMPREILMPFANPNLGARASSAWGQSPPREATAMRRDDLTWPEQEVSTKAGPPIMVLPTGWPP